MYSFMRRVLSTDLGRELYIKRRRSIEPVFGQIKHNRGMTKFRRRGRAAARSEWRLIAAPRAFIVYRRFLNVLARTEPDGELGQLEYIHRFHHDWKKRITAPYWLFDQDLTALDVKTPLHIATYDGRNYSGRTGGLEAWRDSDPKVSKLASLLLRGARPTRRLRTTNAHRAHTPLTLSRGYRTGEKPDRATSDSS